MASRVSFVFILLSTDREIITKNSVERPACSQREKNVISSVNSCLSAAAH